MTSVLIILVLIIAVALLFRLDKKDKDEKAEIERIYDGISVFLDRINWNTSPHRLREIFPNKEFLNSEDQGDLIRTSYKDKFDGQDVIAGFYFSKKGEERLVKADLHLNISKSKLDLLFRKLYEKYGAPSFPDENGGESVLWDLEKGILTLETQEDQTPLLCLWNRDSYSEIR